MTISDLQLQELRRFAELGRLSATMIHEISNPLSAALIQLELSEHKSPAIRRASHSMHILQDYIEAARRQISARGSVKLFAVQPVLNRVEWLTQPLARQHRVSLVMPPRATKYKLRGDPIKLQQVICNLIVNAIQAYHQDGLTQQAAIVKVGIIATKNQLIITVQDHGKGIEPQALTKIFEPFYTTKLHKDGLGIGLAIVKKYMSEDFGGSIDVKSTKTAGTLFSLVFPLPKNG